MMIDELTKEEFASELRESIREELDAINKYSMRARVCPCIYCKTILESIMKEEQVHVGELEYALDMLEQGDSTGRGEGSIEAHNLVFVDEPVPDAQEVDKSVAQFDEPYQLHTDYP